MVPTRRLSKGILYPLAASLAYASRRVTTKAAASG